MLYATGYRWYYWKWGIFFLNVVNLLLFWVCWWQLSMGPRYLPGPSSWLWGQDWTRRDCFAAPVGHFTISFSLRNFKKPSRPHYLCTSFRAAAMWLSSGKAAVRVPAVEREKRVTLLGAGTWDTGRRGSGSQASLTQQALIWHLLCVSDYCKA